MSKKLYFIIFISLIFSSIFTFLIDTQNSDRYEKKIFFSITDIRSNFNLTVISREFALQGIDQVKIFAERLNFDVLHTPNACTELSLISNVLPVLVSYDKNRALRFDLVSENKTELERCKDYIYSEIKIFNLKKRNYYIMLAGMMPNSDTIKESELLFKVDTMEKFAGDMLKVKKSLAKKNMKKMVGISDKSLLGPRIDEIPDLIDVWEKIETQMLGTDNTLQTELKTDLMHRYIYDYLNQRRDANGDLIDNNSFYDKLFEKITEQYLTLHLLKNYDYSGELDTKSNGNTVKSVNMDSLRSLDFLTLDYEVDEVLKKPNLMTIFISIFIVLTSLIIMFYIGSLNKKIRKFIEFVNHKIS